MVDALKGVLELVSQATGYLVTADPITSVWVALCIIILIACFLLGKLLNRDS